MKYLLVVLAVISSFFVAPPASASGCPATELVFARGTSESPGLGEVGDAFAAALNIPVYAVDYPASMSFNDSVLAGVGDIVRHVEACPGTRFVIGGYSQGGSVAAWIGSSEIPPGVDTDLRPLSNTVAGRIRAVVLFAPPSPSFSNLLGVPYAGPGRFQDRTLILCAPGDPVCDGGGDFSIHSSYAANGSIQEAVNYVRNRL
jgi:pimeloyl-ACP methyl ester carboxylesterase